MIAGSTFQREIVNIYFFRHEFLFKRNEFSLRMINYL